jgi:asparagine synthase (glutamine-hydrolysing)
MCGICGTLELTDAGGPMSEALVRGMLASLTHRGPDDEGIHQSRPVVLGHRRLSIIDLSTGRQPLCNEDGSIWVVYNGEVYNYKELTASLTARGHQFRTTTDTEVIVHLYEECGEECVKYLRGMFSFALWDDKKRILLLARDRVGIKPLYYCQTSTRLLFASEIKAIFADPSVRTEVDPAIVHEFLKHFYVPGEETVFGTIRKLKPGHYLIVKNGQINVRQYWDLAFQKATIEFDDAVERLEDLLCRTVCDHMISDVGVGVLLSGGVDSSGVLSFAAENTSSPLKTFTIGFDGEVTDERPYAKLAAKAFGAQNYDLTITAQDFWRFLPKYVWHMEEPVCEPPAVALYYVSKLAREHVTVLLSGEGGDEAFAGYQSYRTLAALEGLKRCLGPLAEPVSALITGVAPRNGTSRWEKYGAFLRAPLEDYYYSHSSTPYEYFNRGSAALYTREFRGAVQAAGRTLSRRQRLREVMAVHPLDQMLYIDTKTWLPDDLLIKADRMTMANSLELRVPLLDHQILEFAASLPARYKLRRTSTKHILKTVLSRRLPPGIIRRKKVGFPVPYTKWLNSELREDVAEILLDHSTIRRGYFRRDVIEEMIRAPAGRNYSKEIFSLIILELVQRTFCDNKVECLC